MKRMSKRFLSMLLAVVMALSMLPVSALAGTVSDVKDDVVGAVNSVLDGFDFSYQGVEVSVDFGGEVDPNGLTDIDGNAYDITAVGAVKLNYNKDAEEGKRLSASGEVELYIPFSMIETAIDEKVNSAIDGIVTPIVTAYEKKVTELATTKMEKYETTVSGTYNGQSLSKTIILENVDLSDVIEVVLNGSFTETFPTIGEQTIYYYQLYSGSSADDQKKAALDAVVTKLIGADRLDINFNVTATNYAYTNWKKDTISTDADIDAQTEKLSAVLCLEYVKQHSDELMTGLSSDLSAAMKLVIGNVKYYDETATRPNRTYYSFDKIKADLSAAINEKVHALVDDSVSSLKSDIKWNFYNPFEPDYEVNPEMPLTGRFDLLLGEETGCIIYDFVQSLPVDVDFDEIKNLLPVDKIKSLETMLQSIVVGLNKDLIGNDTTPVILGGIYGREDEALTVQTQTGMYVVVGGKMDGTMEFNARVIAPEIVRGVSILKDGAPDSNKLLTATVGDEYEISVRVDDDNTEDDYVPDAKNLMNLRITGLTTGGEKYDTEDLKTSTKTSVDEPEDAGVYTVLSIYLDKDTLAMGADVAVLVVEPAKTDDQDFSFTTNSDELTVPYNGEGHYPSIVTGDVTENHAVIKGALSSDQKAAYVILDDIDIVGNVTALEETATEILTRLNKEAKGLYLPTEGLTQYALDAVERLAAYAICKAEEGADGGVLTGDEVKAYLNMYLDALVDYYRQANLTEMGRKAYYAALDAAAQIKEGMDPTIKKYTDLIGTVLDAFESFNTQPAAASTYSLRTAAAEASFMETVATNTSDEVTVLAEKVLNTLLAKSAAYANSKKGVILAALDYATYKNAVTENPYYDDAVTLVMTMGAAVGASEETINAAVAQVEDAFEAMYEGIKSDIKAMLVANDITDVDDLDSLEDIEAALDELGLEDAEALAATVLGRVETFVSVVMTQAKYVVNNTDWKYTTVYFNIKPSEVGTYSCYAVNVNPNYVPNLTQTTLKITAVETECGHGNTKIVKENEVAADCENTGSYESVVYCTDCGVEVSRETKTVDALGHTEGAVVVENNVAPTCTADGSYDNVVYCTVCGEELSRTAVTVNANGHTPGTAMIENSRVASCQEGGSYDSVVYCTVCGEEVSRTTITIGATDHTEGAIVDENKVAATCTNDGSYDNVVYCTVCGEELSRETKTVDALGHTEGAVVVESNVAPTCTVDGSYDNVVYCTACGEELSRETITVAATGEHVYVNEVSRTEPTCEEAGSVTKACGCGETTEETLAATGHEYVGIVTTEPTCSEPGVKTYTCKNDSSHTYTEEVVATGAHNYATEVERVASTCNKTGYVIKTCGCGAQKKTTLAKVDHVWVDYAVISEATCQQPGQKTMICEVCRQTKTVVIPVGDHIDVNDDGKCDVCGEKMVCGNGHTEGTPVEENKIDATCEANGAGSYDIVVYCSVCGHEMDRMTYTIPQEACVDENTDGICDNCGRTICTNEDEWVIRVAEAPTCTKPGLTEGIYCEVHEQVIKAQNILAAPGHDWDEGHVVKEATCSKTGQMIYFCKNDASHEKTSPIPMVSHTDENDDNICDVCGANICEHSNTTKELVKTLPADCYYAVRQIWKYTCEDCGKSWEDPKYVGSKLEHVDENPLDNYCDRCGENICNHLNKELTGYSAPTCLGWEYFFYYCSDCKSNFSTSGGSPLGHVLDGHSADAGYHWYLCGRCEQSYGKTSHTFGVIDTANGFALCTYCNYGRAVRSVAFDESHISEELKATEYSTVEAIEARLRELLQAQNVTITDQNKALVNLEYKYVDSSGAEIQSDNREIPATETVYAVMEVPEALPEIVKENPGNYTFKLIHMFGSGDKVGETEQPEVTVVDGMLQFSIHGTSPGYLVTICANDEGHSYVGGECIICGKSEQTEPDSGLFDISFANMTMGNALDMNFAFEKGHVADWTGHYAVITKEYADGRANVVQTIELGDWVSTNIGGVAHYYVTFAGIAAKEMSDTVTVVIYDAEGEAVSNPWVDSVRAYATRTLNNPNSTDETLTMVVDMLNYGAAAQEYFNYNEADLANANLTEKQKGFATDGAPTYEDTRSKGDNFIGSSLLLESNIKLLVAFQNITTDMKAVVTYTDHYGRDKTVEAEVVSGDGYGMSGYNMVVIESLVVADARKEVTCTIYDGDTKIAWVTDSVESYVAREMASERADILFEQILKFADSAYEFFH